MNGREKREVVKKIVNAINDETKLGKIELHGVLRVMKIYVDVPKEYRTEVYAAMKERLGKLGYKMGERSNGG